MVYVTPKDVNTGVVGGSSLTFVGRMIELLKRCARLQADLREHYKLSDRALAERGLQRAQIAERLKEKHDF